MARAGDALTDMPYFAARDGQPAAYCRDQVRDADVYAGLIGLRYGSPVRDQPQVSYTELEFDTATEAGKPRLMFMLDEDAAVPPRPDACSTATRPCRSGSVHSAPGCWTPGYWQ